MQVSYSAALEVIVHATKHILEKQKISVNSQNRSVLVSKINQIKEMFEEELKDPKKTFNKSPAPVLPTGP